MLLNIVNEAIYWQQQAENLPGHEVGASDHMHITTQYAITLIAVLAWQISSYRYQLLHKSSV